MNTLKKVLFLFLGFIVLVLIAALFAPKEFKAGAEIEINQPSDVVYDYIKFLKNQDNFSVWNQLDPKMIKKYEGTDGTVGFTYKWNSEKFMVGKGKQVITQLVKGQKMESDLFFEDEANPAKSVMIIKTVDPNKSSVSWNVIGESPYPFNLMNWFINMDEDFDQGLQNLKKQLEKK